MRLRRRRRLVPTCYFRHRWAKWAFVKMDEHPGWRPEFDYELQFRMCRACGHQELREVECV